MAERDLADDPDRRTPARAVEALAVHEEALRSAIAARLHDGPVQLLTGASLRLGLLRRQLDALLGDEVPPAVREGVHETERLVISTIESLRREMDDLRAPAEFSVDLADALRTQLARQGLTDRYEVVGGSPDPPGPTRGVLYRLACDVLRAAPIDHGDGIRAIELSVTDRHSRLVVPIAPGGGVPDHVGSWATALDGSVVVETTAAGDRVVIEVPHAG